MRAAQADAAGAIQCGEGAPAVVVDGDAPEAPFGASESRDGIHLNDAGARRYWDQVGGDITRALGVRPRTPPAAPSHDG
ncbi:MAG: hypothetical protein IPL19_29500 [Sandaracinaceae bacterium]|nr:hypothetical protein [Sandaracinaceae bacterium]